MLPTISTDKEFESRVAQKEKHRLPKIKQTIDIGTNVEVEANKYFYDIENLDEDPEFGEFESKTDIVGSGIGSSLKDDGLLVQMFSSLAETEGVFPRQSSNNAISVPVQDEDSETFGRLSLLDRDEKRYLSISSLSSLANSCCIEDMLKTKRCLLDSNVSIHYNVMQHRLRCGSLLEMQRKKMKKLEKNPQLRNNIAKKYNTLQEEYINLCIQESVIRDRIATLQADIYEGQNKYSHKQTVAMKTVLLVPGSSHHTSVKMENKRLNERDQRKHGLLFPPLPPPKPLLLPKCKSTSNQSVRISRRTSKMSFEASVRRKFVKLSNRVKPATFDNLPPTCTFYSFYPLLTSPRQHKRPTPAIPRESDSEEKIAHRLKKYKRSLELEHNIRLTES